MIHYEDRAAATGCPPAGCEAYAALVCEAEEALAWLRQFYGRSCCCDEETTQQADETAADPLQTRCRDATTYAVGAPPLLPAGLQDTRLHRLRASDKVPLKHSGHTHAWSQMSPTRHARTACKPCHRTGKKSKRRQTSIQRLFSCLCQHCSRYGPAVCAPAVLPPCLMIRLGPAIGVTCNHYCRQLTMWAG